VTGVAIRLRRWLGRLRFHGPKHYWERRYASGGDSGPGSYGRLAEFKAEVLNEFVKERRIASVVEFGCGDGHQLGFADYPEYTGIDVAPSAIARCRLRFSGDPTKRFALIDPEAEEEVAFSADLALSLDVVYHLVEDRLYEQHLNALFASATRYVIIYSSDHANNDTTQPAHVRHRAVSAWVAEHQPAWRLERRIENPHPFTGDVRAGSHSDFLIYRRV
jgi:SAM-dependent methyltransferase